MVPVGMLPTRAHVMVVLVMRGASLGKIDEGIVVTVGDGRAELGRGTRSLVS